MCHNVTQIFDCGHSKPSKRVKCKKPTSKCGGIFLRQELENKKGLCVVSCHAWAFMALLTTPVLSESGEVEVGTARTIYSSNRRGRGWGVLFMSVSRVRFWILIWLSRQMSPAAMDWVFHQLCTSIATITRSRSNRYFCSYVVLPYPQFQPSSSWA